MEGVAIAIAFALQALASGRVYYITRRLCDTLKRASIRVCHD
jgi:hypothetical protein